MITFLSGASGSGGPGTSGTSGTSGFTGDLYETTSITSINLSTLSIGVNTNITIGLNLAYSIAQSVLVANSISNYFEGSVVSYNSATGAMVIDVTNIVGSGTFSSWEVNLSGAAGGDGTSGTSGSSGVQGSAGSSGSSGVNGTSGSSGSSG